MKQIFISALLLITMSLGIEAGTYSFCFQNSDYDGDLFITWMETDVTDTLKVENGKVVLKKVDFKPQYIKVMYGKGLRGTLFLSPDKSLVVNNNYKERSTVCSGELADINNYLLSTEYAKVNKKDAGKEFHDLLQICDTTYKANLEKLESSSLPEDFKKSERIRVKYISYSILPRYQAFYAALNNKPDFVPSQEFYKKLMEIANPCDELISCPGYLSMVERSINATIIGKYGNDESSNTIKFLDENISQQKVKDYVVYAWLNSKISRYGVDGTDEMVEYFFKTAKTPIYLNKFKNFYSEWEPLKAGKPSPTFNYPNINGEYVSLESLKGKYVYIDVWATWCAPCRKELPYLFELEKYYEGKDIHFVSMSCDNDRQKWEKMVKLGKFGGIQLIMGDHSEFMKKYCIDGVPRFILLDREGKIIKAVAPRPSNKKTKILLDKLLEK
ncbi:MAG: TlpA family protein disulfide reductase [Prevotella sp.]